MLVFVLLEDVLPCYLSDSANDSEREKIRSIWSAIMGHVLMPVEFVLIQHLTEFVAPVEFLLQRDIAECPASIHDSL